MPHDGKPKKLEGKKLLPCTKLPVQIKTVSDLFARDDVNDFLATVDKHKADITDCIIVYLDKERNYHWAITDNTLESTAVWLLESTKHDLMHSDDE